MPASAGGFGTFDHNQCTAISKRSGERCKGPAIVGSPNQKCRMHGGNSAHAVGANNHNFKNGRHSKYLPPHLDELYQEALSNPDLLDMAENIALLEARIKQMLTEIAEGDPMPRWSDLGKVFANIETALLSGKVDESIAAMEQMHHLLDNGAKWDTAWHQITETMEQLRKLTDTEIKRKKDLNQMIPVERVIVLMAMVGDAVKRHVKNPEEIKAVYEELAKLHGADTVDASQALRRKELVPMGSGIVDVTPKRGSKVLEEGSEDGITEG